MSTIKAGNIRKGSYIIVHNQIVLVTKADFSFTGRGSAFMKVKFRNLKTGNSNEATFRSSETVEEPDVESRELQYLYHDSSEVVFMDQRSYEQEAVPLGLLDGKLGFLTPEIKIYIQFYQDKAVGVSFPPKVSLKVTDAPDATAGNRATAAKKSVTLETGLVVQAPLFIKTGESLVIDTTSGEYVSRA